MQHVLSIAFRRKIKEAVALLFHYAGISRIFFLLNRGRKRILTYHNVLPRNLITDSLLDGVSHSDDSFARQLDFILGEFSCSLDLADPKSVTITFDDGYINQREVAHPILARAGVKAYFFVSGNLLASGEPLAIDLLQCWMSNVQAGTYTPVFDGRSTRMPLEISSEKSRRSCWGRLDALLNSGQVSQVELVEALYGCVPRERIVERLDTEYRRLRLTPLTSEDLAGLKAYGHLVGSHGVSHEILAGMNEDRLESELRAADPVGNDAHNTDVLSYPFGGQREVPLRVIDVMRHVGRTTALANVNGPLAEGRRFEQLFMPRMSLPDDGRSHILSFVLSGAEHFLKYRQLLPRWI